MIVSFFDPNIFLYAASNAPEDVEKKQRATRLIREVPCVISAQVLQEFIANALRKKSLGLDETHIDGMLEFFRQAPVQPVTRELVQSACRIRLRFGISQWDASILAAAMELGCKTLFTEDISHGQNYDGVEVINPFL